MMDGISMNKIKHHDLFVIIRPELGTLHAVDTLDISGEDDLTFHLGNRFTIQSVEQHLKPWTVASEYLHSYMHSSFE